MSIVQCRNSNRVLLCCVNCRNAGKEGSTEHTGRSVLDKIPFLRSCDDEDDSDEDDDFQGIATDCIDGPHKNKKSRGKVRSDANTHHDNIYNIIAPYSNTL